MQHFKFLQENSANIKIILVITNSLHAANPVEYFILTISPHHDPSLPSKDGLYGKSDFIHKLQICILQHFTLKLSNEINYMYYIAYFVLICFKRGSIHFQDMKPSLTDMEAVPDVGGREQGDGMEKERGFCAQFSCARHL